MTRMKVKGIVVDQHPMGEKDIRITLLTPEQGNIDVIAKGAKSPSAKQAACASYFVFSDFVLESGKSFAYIREYEILDMFYRLRQDPDRFLYASVMAELARIFAVDGESNASLVKLLIYGFRKMCRDDADPELIGLTFMMKLMAQQGMSPVTDRCLHCGTPYDHEKNWHLSIDEGGLVCERCMKTSFRGILPGSVMALTYIRSADLKRLYQFRVSDEVRKELSQLIPSYMLFYTGIKPKSLTVLEEMKK